MRALPYLARELELGACELAAPHQNLPEPFGPDVGAGEDDIAVFEVNTLRRTVLVQVQYARLPTGAKSLEDLCQPGPL